MKRSKKKLMVIVAVAIAGLFFVPRTMYADIITKITTTTIYNACTGITQETVEKEVYDTETGITTRYNNNDTNVKAEVNNIPVQTSNSQPTAAVRQNNTVNENVSQNEIEKRILDLVNVERARVGVGSLTYDDKLYEISKYKTNDMAYNNYFEHTSPSGETLTSLFAKFSYNYSACAENILYAFENNADKYYSIWANSPGHYANIVNPNYTNVSVAITYDANTGRYYSAMHFSKK